MFAKSSLAVMKRPADRFLLMLGGFVSVFLLTMLDTYFRSSLPDTRLTSMSRQVKELDLTDLSLFTEARYTRHLSQADRHSAFQDHPLALEHFPGGSLVLPPEALR